jgi:hypothetical protein
MVRTLRAAMMVRRGVVALAVQRADGQPWSASVRVDDAGGGHVHAIRALLDQAPRRWFELLAVQVALSPFAFQLRQLKKVPLGSGEADVHAIVTSQPRRHFLALEGTPFAARVIKGAGAWWGLSFPTELVEIIRTAHSRPGIRLVGLLPCPVLTRSAEGSSRSVVADDGWVFEADWTDGVLESARRRRAAEAPQVPPDVDREVLAEATALVFSPPHGTFLFDPGLETARTGRTRRRRAAMALAAILSLLFALLGPQLRAFADVGLLRRSVGIKSENGESLKAIAAALADDVTALRSVDTFHRSRRSEVATLAAFARRLPPSSAILSWSSEADRLSVVLLTPIGTPLVSLLSDVEGLGSPRVLGPVTRETVGAVDLQRTMIEFGRRVSMSEPALPPPRGDDP